VFSFLTRFFSNRSLVCDEKLSKEVNLLPIDHLHRIAEEENALFVKDFSLFYQERHNIIDLFMFLPYRGICFGEEIDWDFEALSHATIESSSPSKKKDSTTHLAATESLISQKLEEILSFNTTVCERFFWMSALKEDEFDILGPSFHTLMPKERLIFSDSSYESIRHKIESIAPRLDFPYSTLKIMGSLQSHLLLTPTEDSPFGNFVSEEQQQFILTDYSDTLTSLFGEHNSGKSSAIIRKVLFTLLTHPKEKIIIITPNRIGSEILRHELISLLEYGALKIDLSLLTFHTPDESEKIHENDYFLSASSVLLDDAHLMKKQLLDTLIEHRGNRWILFSMHNDYRPISDSSVIFYNHYQKNIDYRKIPTSANQLLHTLLLELRRDLLSTSPERIMVMFENHQELHAYKEAIDEYFEINCRIVNKDFSLQYQNLDDLILTTHEYTYGIHVPHLYFVVSDQEENYSYALSRASESATIISVSNAEGDENG
jgi:hypothetical protein